MDLYILHEINKLKNGGGGGSSTTSSSTGLFPQEAATQTSGSQTVVSFSGIHERYFHQSYDYNTSHPQIGTFHHYDGGWQQCEMKWRVARGQGGYAFSGDGVNTANNTKAIRTHYNKHQHMGSMHMQTMEGRSSDNYAPMGVNLMFIRNTTDSNITKQFEFYYSNRWNNGYEGAAVHMYTPNHVDHTQVTANTSGWSTPWNTSSGGSYHTDAQFNMTIPANKTVAVMGINTLHYWTASSYWTHMRHVNYFSNMNQWLDGTGQLVCDLQMSPVFKQAYIPDMTSNNYGGDSFYRFYNKCGAIFGNRPTN